MASNVAKWTLTIAVALLATGCRPLLVPQSHVGYYLDRQMLPGRVHNVVFLPLANDTGYPPVSEGTTTALFQAIQGRQLFYITLAQLPETPADGNPVDVRKAFTLKDLAQMRQSFGSDAVLIGTVTQFHPYPRMQLGLYLRLVDLRDSRIIWSVDHVWDATDKATQTRMEAYFHDQRGTGFDPITWRLTAVSPAEFEQFVAYEIVGTLPKSGDRR
jgi:hypothetical protein